MRQKFQNIINDSLPPVLQLDMSAVNGTWPSQVSRITRQEFLSLQLKIPEFVDGVNCEVYTATGTDPEDDI